MSYHLIELVSPGAGLDPAIKWALTRERGSLSRLTYTQGPFARNMIGRVGSISNIDEIEKPREPNRPTPSVDSLGTAPWVSCQKQASLHMKGQWYLTVPAASPRCCGCTVIDALQL